MRDLRSSTVAAVAQTTVLMPFLVLALYAWFADHLSAACVMLIPAALIVVTWLLGRAGGD